MRILGVQTADESHSEVTKDVSHAGVQEESFQPLIPDIREQSLDWHREELYNMPNIAITFSKSGDQGDRMDRDPSKPFPGRVCTRAQRRS
jgi:hypothetical protein